MMMNIYKGMKHKGRWFRGLFILLGVLLVSMLFTARSASAQVVKELNWNRNMSVKLAFPLDAPLSDTRDITSQGGGEEIVRVSKGVSFGASFVEARQRVVQISPSEFLWTFQASSQVNPVPIPNAFLANNGNLGSLSIVFAEGAPPQNMTIHVKGAMQWMESVVVYSLEFSRLSPGSEW